MNRNWDLIKRSKSFHVNVYRKGLVALGYAVPGKVNNQVPYFPGSSADDLRM